MACPTLAELLELLENDGDRGRMHIEYCGLCRAWLRLLELVEVELGTTTPDPELVHVNVDPAPD